MSDVGKWTTVYQGWCPINCLYQVWFDGIFKNKGKRTFNFKITYINWCTVITVGNYNVSQTFFKVINISSQAKNRHDFRRNSNIKTIFTWNTIKWSAKTNVYMTKRTVIKVNHTFPNDTTLVNAESISLMNMVVKKG